MRRLPLLVLVLAALGGCSTGDTVVPATEVILVVDATSDVRTRSDSLEVTISGSTEREGPFTDSLTLTYGPPASRIGFPRHIALVPQMGDAKRFFEVTATAKGSGTMVASTLVRSGYLEHQTLQLRIVLDDSCRPVSCPIGQTCRHGVCQEVFIDPGTLQPVDAGPADAGSDLGTTDGAIVDAGDDLGAMDGGTVDGGCTGNAICDDHDPCDGVEQCIEGNCVPDTSRVSCDDHVGCTMDMCVTGLGCQHMPLDANCTALAGGRCDMTADCQYPTCTTGTCMSDATTCMTASCSGATCDRVSTCTAGQVCCSGTCDTPGCDDGNPCTDDRCGGSGCTHLPNTAACSDGNLCTVGDACGGGLCRGGASSCDDGNPCTADACGATGCTHMIDNTAPCDDGDGCSFSDRCLAGHCQGTTILDACDDSNLCTTDSCDPATGNCVHAAASAGASCDDLDSCFTGGHCSGTSCVGGHGCGTSTPVCCPSGGCRPVAGSCL